ncbi:MAG: signal peptide peptidase SppA [Candidatus Zixiibacteriota bacterium]|nr:MAG: signal peptide peptidase SppA [candidate division Zixibacteria bacterium]
MKHREILRCTLLLLLATVLGRQPAEGQRLEIPQGVFYYQPAASVFGSEAAWVNPAGLGMFRVSGFQFMADYLEGDYANGWGSVIHREGIAMVYRAVHNRPEEDYVEYILALGAPLGKKAAFGGSYRYFKSGAFPFDNRHFWNLGMIHRLSQAVSLGALFSNLNRGKVNGDRTETEMRYSLAYRLKQYDVTLALDMLLSTGTRLSNADYIYHLEASPIKGLYINGFIDSDKNFQVGVRANFLQYFVGTRYNSDRDGNHLGTTGFAGATSRKQPSLIKERTRRLALSISRRPHENPARPVFGKKERSLLTTLLNIYRAADDPGIGEMVLSLDRLSLGFAQAQELREAIRFFRSRGKPVICHMTYPSNISYYVASGCDKILIPPVSQLNLVGLRAELTFYAGTLEKLGIKVDLMRIGRYKTAAESLTRESATEENREQVNRLLDDLFDQFAGGIAEGRGISKDSVAAIIDGGPYTSEQALAFGLVDGLSYRDEMTNEFLAKMPEVSFRKYLTDTLINDDWGVRPAIAVVVADGEMTFDRGAKGPFSEATDVTPSKMKKAFGRAKADRDIKGVVFRINSPGGLALAGEEIYHAAQRTAEVKPVIVSMSNVAASGGYYIAMPGKHLVTNPATITGSIGIYGGKADLSGLYEKIDLGKELFTRGKYAGMLTTMRPFTDDEREKYFSQMKAFYGHFVSLVAGNRDMEADSVDSLGQGQVWTGREALRHGLVDEVGGLKAALDFTARELGVKEYDVEILPRKRPLFVLPASTPLKFAARLFGLVGGEDGSSQDAIQGVFTEGLLARLPFDIEIE